MVVLYINTNGGRMKLSEYAKQKNVHYRTALRWFKEGKIPNARQLPTGTIVIEDDAPVDVVEELRQIKETLKSLQELGEATKAALERLKGEGKEK